MCVRVCVCACVRACVRVCVWVRVRACVCGLMWCNVGQRNVLLNLCILFVYRCLHQGQTHCWWLRWYWIPSDLGHLGSGRRWLVDCVNRFNLYGNPCYMYMKAAWSILKFCYYIRQTAAQTSLYFRKIIDCPRNIGVFLTLVLFFLPPPPPPPYRVSATIWSLLC